MDYVNTQASKYRTNNIMLTMGDDFHFMAAEMWFKNMDKLIKYLSLMAAIRTLPSLSLVLGTQTHDRVNSK